MLPVSKDPSKEDPEVLKQRGKTAPRASLIPYSLSGGPTPALDNGNRYVGKKPSANAFGIKDIPEQ